MATTRNWRSVATITDPPFVMSLLGSTRWAWLWLIIGYMLVMPG